MLDALPGFFDNTRCIGTKDMRQRDLGRVFAAHNPDVKVIERESLHADKDFVVVYLRNWKIADLDSLVTSEFVIVECFHGSFSCMNYPPLNRCCDCSGGFTVHRRKRSAGNTDRTSYFLLPV